MSEKFVDPTKLSVQERESLNRAQGDMKRLGKDAATTLKILEGILSKNTTAYNSAVGTPTEADAKLDLDDAQAGVDAMKWYMSYDQEASKSSGAPASVDPTLPSKEEIEKISKEEINKLSEMLSKEFEKADEVKKEALKPLLENFRADTVQSTIDYLKQEINTLEEEANGLKTKKAKDKRLAEATEKGKLVKILEAYQQQLLEEKGDPDIKKLESLEKEIEELNKQLKDSRTEINDLRDTQESLAQAIEKAATADPKTALDVFSPELRSHFTAEIFEKVARGESTPEEVIKISKKYVLDELEKAQKANDQAAIKTAEDALKLIKQGFADIGIPYDDAPATVTTTPEVSETISQKEIVRDGSKIINEFISDFFKGTRTKAISTKFRDTELDFTFSFKGKNDDIPFEADVIVTLGNGTNHLEIINLKTDVTAEANTKAVKKSVDGAFMMFFTETVEKYFEAEYIKKPTSKVSIKNSEIAVELK